MEKSDNKDKLVKKVESTLDWGENKGTVLYSLPLRRIQDLNIIWLRTEGLSMQQIATRVGVTKGRVRLVLRGK